MRLSRQAMIDKLEWNNGGYGFGIPSFGNALAWAMDEPGSNRPDLKSIVALHGPPDKYSDEELSTILLFAKRVTARYDDVFRYRRGANLILLDKQANDRWMRKRLTWEYGPMYSNTLTEALAIMER